MRGPVLARVEACPTFMGAWPTLWDTSTGFSSRDGVSRSEKGRTPGPQGGGGRVGTWLEGGTDGLDISEELAGAILSNSF